MRTLVALMLLTTPAAAWEFTPGLPCLLTHDTPGVQVQLTYVPTLPEYTITITTDQSWPRGPEFAMQFEGPFPLSISTNRHVLSRDGKSLTVTDRGFDNVLNGLQFNSSVTASSGGASVTVKLDGAEEQVAAFRLCQPVPGV